MDRGQSASSYIFAHFEFERDKIGQLELVAVHSNELKFGGELRILDSMSLCFNERFFDNKAVEQIYLFAKLQSLPACFVCCTDESAKGLAYFKNRLETIGCGIPDGWSFVVLDAATIDATSKACLEDFNSARSSLLWAKHNLNSFIELAKSQPFVNLAVALDALDTSNYGNSLIEEEMLIFVDLEATGLDTQVITEICLIAISKRRLLAASTCSVTDDCDTMNLIVDPKIEINAHASNITRLTRSLIARSEKNSFNEEVANAIGQFLSRYPGPLSLVSHGGLVFDFPVLRKHMSRFPSQRALIHRLQMFDTMTGFKQARVRGRLGLEAIYSRCFRGRSQPDSHTAQSDAVALMQIINLYPNIIHMIGLARL